jgi:hypothetical protein
MAMGYCRTHYQRFRRTKFSCSIDDCDTASGYCAKGLCVHHYEQQRKKQIICQIIEQTVRHTRKNPKMSDAALINLVMDFFT